MSLLSLGELGLDCSSTLLLSALLLAGFASCLRLWLSAFYLNKSDRPIHSEQKWQMVFDSVIVSEDRAVGP